MVGTTQTNTTQLSYETVPVPIIDPDATEKRQAIQPPDLPIFLAQLIQDDRDALARAQAMLEERLLKWPDHLAWRRL